MDSFGLENRRLLLLGVCASLGVSLLPQLDQLAPAIEETFARDSHKETIEVAPDPAPSISRKPTEAYVYDVDVDVIPSRAAHEELKPPPQPRIVVVGKVPRPGLTSSPNAFPALPASASVAETAYVMFWEEFIGDMNLSDELSVRAIITEWHQFNLELIFAQQEGHITIYELAQSILSVEDLQARLAPYLTASQLIDIEANFEAFMEYVAGEHA